MIETIVLSLTDPGRRSRPAIRLRIQLMHAFSRQPAFRIERCDAAHARGAYGLSIHAVGEIARGEHAFDIRRARTRAQEHITLVIEFETGALQELRRGRVAYGDEDAFHIQRRFFTTDGVLHAHAMHMAIAEHIDDLFVPQHLRVRRTQ